MVTVRVVVAARDAIAVGDRGQQRLVGPEREALATGALNAARVERPCSARAQLGDEAEQPAVLAHLLALDQHRLVHLRDHLGELVLQAGVGRLERAGRRGRRSRRNGREHVRGDRQGRPRRRVQEPANRAHDPEARAQELQEVELCRRSRRHLHPEVLPDRRELGALGDEQALAHGVELREERHNLARGIDLGEHLVDHGGPVGRVEAAAVRRRPAGPV